MYSQLPDPSPANVNRGYYSVQYDRWLPSLSPSPQPEPPPPSPSEIPLPPSPPPATPTKRKNGKQMISMKSRKPRTPKQRGVTLRDGRAFVCITLCMECKDTIKVEEGLLKISLCSPCKTRLLK
ncbi:hypothetical protein GCK72_003878 [Caenorhabditis remanei]|uniref:Uncharacterized protein n=1 Tax=Caenorhabditis remanei TaxID=31234 RepID=A0A6A5HC03_CAERE|nr:hypothetical protein GCK72_003875 [Caenorhabditis remanei]XP_053588498.1 hypothetical protein GCK72_003878 [Caenorhabditis remanei]KAF1763929.1 hypothetical protein GCK72_003875 [Caenorhabditis remanei]KAF1763932.1 hypothetical protein GCK72_003878 [Caenorhabditis remanei]